MRQLMVISFMFYRKGSKIVSYWPIFICYQLYFCILISTLLWDNLFNQEFKIRKESVHDEGMKMKVVDNNLHCAKKTICRRNNMELGRETSRVEKGNWLEETHHNSEDSG